MKIKKETRKSRRVRISLKRIGMATVFVAFLLSLTNPALACIDPCQKELIKSELSTLMGCPLARFSIYEDFSGQYLGEGATTHFFLWHYDGVVWIQERSIDEFHLDYRVRKDADSCTLFLNNSDISRDIIIKRLQACGFVQVSELENFATPTGFKSTGQCWGCCLLNFSAMVNESEISIKFSPPTRMLATPWFEELRTKLGQSWLLEL